MIRFSHLLLASALSLSALAASAAAGHAPAIVAHRGGTADAPENTRIAIETALKNGADAIWITLQESKDGVIVLYRPSDLKELTNRQGPVSAYTAAQLAETDAGWAFAKGDAHPFRGQGIGIPRLDDVLKTFPHVTFYLDIKSPDADPAQFGQALLATLQSTDSLTRIRVYSTDAKYLQALPPAIPRFESCDETRTLLANVTMAHQCDVKPDNQQPRWYVLELKREVVVVEKYTLGEGRSRAFLTWDKESMDCFRPQGPAHIILFGVNSPQEYQQALALGADGVMVNSPGEAKSFRKAK